MTNISIEGLDKAEVLAALYNAARPQGMGFMQYDPTPMEAEEAANILDKHGAYFDYLKGRVMKLSLEGDTFDAGLYDRDNGDGTAQKVIVLLRAGNSAELSMTTDEIHRAGRSVAADITRNAMDKDTTVKPFSGATYVSMGLSDVADKLGPAVDEALDN